MCHDLASLLPPRVQANHHPEPFFQFLNCVRLLYLPPSGIPFLLLIPVFPPDPFLDLLHVFSPPLTCHSISLFEAFITVVPLDLFVTHKVPGTHQMLGEYPFLLLLPDLSFRPVCHMGAP